MKQYLRIHWRFSTILKTSSKSVSSNVFCYVKVCILWKCIQYTIRLNQTQVKNEIPLDKINVTKNALFFVSSNSSQFYFLLAILERAEAQLSYLRNSVWDFAFSIPSCFYKGYSQRKAPLNKTPALTKSTNMGIWVVKSTLYKGFLNWNKILKKIK